MKKDDDKQVTRLKGDQDAPTDLTRLIRASVAALDEMLGHPFHVLDGGFVRVIDYMGHDSSIVQAARVSYGVGTKQIQDDRGLIRYLLRHSHSTPFEMCEIKFHLRVPMDIWRQWIRHRTANVNEYSTRYSIAIDAAHRTPTDRWRQQSQDNRQGSSDFLSTEVGSALSAAEADLQDRSRSVYEERIAAGVAREQARKDLPLSTYTEAYWKIDLHNLLNFLNLRMHEHAQEEIRAYATTIGEKVVAAWVPTVWEAFLDYRRHAVQLSRIETQIIAALSTGDHKTAAEIAKHHGFLKRRANGALQPNRERRELEGKLSALGLIAKWDDIPNP